MGGGDVPHPGIPAPEKELVAKEEDLTPCDKKEMSALTGSTSSSLDHPKETAVTSTSDVESGIRGSMDEYELVFMKDNVSVHPTQNTMRRINGCLRLIKQGTSLFMTWIPHAHGWITPEESNLSVRGRLRDGMANSIAAQRDRNLYTIRAVALSEMRSIRRHTPPFGWHYIIIVLASGLAFPPLYFHSGGIKEFLGTIRNYALLVRSAEDANVYIVNDTQDPLQKSLTSLELTDNSASAVQASGLEAAWPVLLKQENTVSSSSLVESESKQNPRRGDSWRSKDLSINVLEKFSLITKFARETGRVLVDGFDLDKDHRPPQDQRGKEGVRDTEDLKKEESISETKTAEVLFVPLTAEAEFNAESADDQAATNVGTFELVDGAQDDTPALVWGRARPPPLGSEEWRSFLDYEGRVVDSKALKKRIFHGGIEPEVRHVIWKFLLGYHSFDSTYAEREYLMVQKKEEYDVLKSQWQTVSPEQAKRFAKYRERKHRVEKDVVRTDRTFPYYAGEGADNPNVTVLRDILVTYSFYNFDLGYCQGMSDLLSPILYVMDNESEAFWCFAALMERLGPNFHRDQNGMHSQLLAMSKLVQLLDWPLHDYFKLVDCLNYFFCFRWILIQFKREFEFENVLKLWEVLWTNYLSEHFHLYICVGVLKRHRRRIMDEQMEFDTLLKFINELSGHLHLESTLRDAEALCRFAGERGAACIPPGTPPSLALEVICQSPSTDNLWGN